MRKEEFVIVGFEQRLFRSFAIKSLVMGTMMDKRHLYPNFIKMGDGHFNGTGCFDDQLWLFQNIKGGNILGECKHISQKWEIVSCYAYAKQLLLGYRIYYDIIMTT